MIDALRDAAWLTEQRGQAYCRILAAIIGIVSIAWIVVALAHGGVDPAGHAIGADFAPYWSAAKLAAAGHPGSGYDVVLHDNVQREAFGGALTDGPTPFVYPPPFLLLLLPFATLPYLVALLVWLGMGVALYYASVRAIGAPASSVLAILVYPGFLLTMLNGQNGALSAALLAGAMLWLDRRPGLAGLCLGCLIYKPQLALVVPFVLLSDRRWTTLATAGLTASVLAVASMVAFGAGLWADFFDASSLARHLLEAGLAGPDRMVSSFAAAQMLHAPVWLAYAVQGVSAVIAIIGVLSVRSPKPDLARGALVCAATPLISPYMFDYDLAVLAAPMVWILLQARGQFMQWKKIGLLGMFIWPILARTVATYAGLPLSPVMTLAFFLLVRRRALGQDRNPVVQRDAGRRQGAVLVTEGVAG